MSRLSRWLKENVEIVDPFERKDVFDEYDPLGGLPKSTKIQVGFGRMRLMTGPPRCPCDPPRRYIWFKLLCGGIALALIIAILLYLTT